MSSDFQKVIQRVRLVSPEGVIFKPRSRVLSALDSIAAGTHHEAPEHGICRAASVLGERGQGKGRRTFFTAVKEAVGCGLVRRASVKPKPGVRFQASVYYLSHRLIEAAATGFKGDLLMFQAPFEPPGKQGASAEIKAANARVQHSSSRLATQVIRDARNVAAEVKAPPKTNKSKVSISKLKENEVNHCIKTQECNFCTMEVHGTRPRPRPPAAPSVVAVPAQPGLGCPVVSGCLVVSPPHGGAGAGGIQLISAVRDVKAAAAQIFENVGGGGGELVEFLRFMGGVDVDLDFQARRKTIDKRGARLWKKLGDDPAVALVMTLNV